MSNRPCIALAHCAAGMPAIAMAARALLSVAALALGGLASAADPHAGHAAAPGQSRSVQEVVLPTVKVMRADGKRMLLAEAIDDGRPVVLNFIYTSCNAICPVTSQVFVELRERLGTERDKVNMVSISIDPEQDTPRKLTEYAARFGSAGAWPHYTSSSADAILIQRAFGAWRGDKMNHQPTTYMRAAPGKPWVRLDGFFGPAALVGEYMKTTLAPGMDACSEPGKNGSTASPTAGTRAGITMKSKS
ncbi:MAG: SCO family protein [Burkholderiaceae bacterium]